MNGMCDCGKRIFFTEQDAKMAVNDIIERKRQGGATRRRERRAYRCPNDRNTWHLTSWETPDGALLTKQGVGNLTPKDVADLIEEMYPDARVEEARNGYKVYPSDKSHSPIFFSDRFNNGTGRSNCIAQLRKAGLDIMATPEPETPMSTNDRAPLTQPLIQNPPLLDPAVAISGLINQIGELNKQQDAVLEMLAEAEKRTTVHEKQLNALATLVGGVRGSVGTEISDLLKRIIEAEKLDKVRRDAIDKLQTQRSQDFTRIKVLEQALAQGAPAEQPKVDPTAELDAAILEFMAGTPIALSASVISANIKVDATGNQVGKRLQALANDGKISVVDRPGVAKLYTYKKESDDV